MLIRIKQVRVRPLPQGGFRYGSTIDLTPRGSSEKRIYLFRPLDPKNPEADHVCDVTDRGDIALMLSQPNQFEIHESVPTRSARGPDAQADTGGEQKPPAGGNGSVDYSAMSKDELLSAVHQKTGKRPHPSTSTKKLLAQLTG